MQMKKVTSYLRDLIDSSNPASSKRAMGILGWIVVMGVFIYCSVTQKQVPTGMDTFFITSAGLLGLDSITSIFKRNE